MNNSEKWIANPEVVLRVESDEWALLFDPESGQVVGVNPVGAAVWKLMDGKNSPAQIAEQVKNDFTDAPESILEEIHTFFNSLVERGFIGKVS